MDLNDPALSKITGTFGGWSADPRDIAQSVYDAHRQYPNVPVWALGGIISQESSMNPEEKGAAGEEGIAQFMPTTGKSLGADGKPYVDNPWNPHASIFGAAKLLDDTMAGGKVPLTEALRQYNGGSAANNINPINQNYVANVMAKGQDFLKQYPEDQFLSDPKLDAIDNVFKPDPKFTSAPPSTGSDPLRSAPGAELPTTPPASSPTVLSSQSPADIAAGNAAGTWGRLDNKLNAATLGLAPRAEAAYGAMTTPGATYSGIRSAQQGGEAAYAAAQPTEAFYDKTVGSIPATMLLTGGLGAAADAGAAALGRAVPAIEPAVGAASDFLSGNAGDSLLGRMASRGASNVTQGAVGGALNSGLSPDSTGKQALIGGIAGAAFTPAGSILQDIIAPRLTPEMANLYQTARANGVDLSLRDIAPSAPLSSLASPSEPRELTALAARQVGSSVPLLTRANLQQAQSQTGDLLDAQYPRLTVRIGTDPTPGGASPLLDLTTDFLHNVNPQDTPTTYNAIQRTLDATHRVMQPTGAQVMTAAGPRSAEATVAGNDLANLIQSRRPVAMLRASSDPIQNYYGNQLHRLLIDGAYAGSAPEDAAELLRLNQQYSVGAALGPAADKAGAAGVLNPADVAGSLMGRNEPQAKLLSNIARVMPPKADAEGNVKTGLGTSIAQGLRQIAPAIAGGAAGNLLYSPGQNLGLTAAVGGGAALGVKALASTLANNASWKNALSDMALNNGQNIGLRIPQNLPPAAAALAQHIYDYHTAQNPGQVQ